MPKPAARNALILRLDLQCAGASGALPEKHDFARWARAALGGIRRRRVDLVVRIVGAAEGARLNSRYRGKPRPTNVLSFPFDPPPGARSFHLGDLVLCAPLVRHEARAQGKREIAHWAHLVVHGIMHLRGYDHQNERAARVMEAREARVLKQLGFPDPYRPDARHSSA